MFLLRTPFLLEIYLTSVLPFLWFDFHWWKLLYFYYFKEHVSICHSCITRLLHFNRQNILIVCNADVCIYWRENVKCTFKQHFHLHDMVVNTFLGVTNLNNLISLVKAVKYFCDCPLSLALYVLCISFR